MILCNHGKPLDPTCPKCEEDIEIRIQNKSLQLAWEEGAVAGMKAMKKLIDSGHVNLPVNPYKMVN